MQLQIIKICENQESEENLKKYLQKKIDAELNQHCIFENPQ